ncbi:hypothetical protein B0T13DRAFT_499049 [Neurospora crassa]|nr:hypothetical protein B0T13DRAFT_499049 [Neurospora crassa]
MSEHEAVPVHLVAAQPSEPANQPGTMSDDRPIPRHPRTEPSYRAPFGGWGDGWVHVQDAAFALSAFSLWLGLFLADIHEIIHALTCFAQLRELKIPDPSRVLG